MMTAIKVTFTEFREGARCPKCFAQLPKRLLRSHDAIARCAFRGWGDRAEEALRQNDIPEEVLARQCECGYVEMHWTIDSGRLGELVVEIGE